MNKKELRIIFLGTPDFAVASLNAIIEAGFNVVAVITSPDRKSGRGQKINQSAVKKYAVEKGLTVLQPPNLKDPTFIEELQSFKADLQIVVAFRMLPEIIWNMPPMGTFNLHASLLPKYRGAAPINWAIINQEKVSGITTFFLKHEIDTGDIILQKEINLDSHETAGSLHDKLMEAGGKLVVESLDLILKDDLELKQQNQTEDSIQYAPKIFREDCQIDWHLSSAKIDAFIRGLSPYPAAWTTLINRTTAKAFNFKIFQCKIKKALKLKAGEMKLIEGELFIGTADFALELTEVQLEGKKRMMTKDLVNGINISDYEIHT